MAPFSLTNGAASFSGFIVPFLIGMGFGYVLEVSGFGDSRKLSGQFYLRDMTVLKVMFTGIIVAMTLVFLSSSFGLLDMERIYINPTYFPSGILGGLIMGVGFIVGGFCPGTSLVAASTFKLDGIFFVLGAFFGVFLFGESVTYFEQFFYSNLIERFTLYDLFGVPAGVVVVGVLLMALVMFYLAEISEKVFGEGKEWSEINKFSFHKNKLIASGVILFLGIIVLFHGQPSIQDKWQTIATEENKKIEAREIYVHPAEFHAAMNDPLLYNVVLDVRNESDYNMFHLESALHVTKDDLTDGAFIKRLNTMPANTVKMLVSNGEKDATEAYKTLRAQGVINLYVLEGGVNNWLHFYPPQKQEVFAVRTATSSPEEMKVIFANVYGDSVLSANPEIEHGDHHATDEPEYTKKIKIETKAKVTGGCG